MIGFDEFMAEALYGPTGFYATGRGAGRHRDFITSPELGPLFGAVVAHALDAWWDELGQPDPFVVIEAGCGPGALAAAVLLSQPRCHQATALTYVLVERSDVTRSEAYRRTPGLDEWPDLPERDAYPEGVHVVIANELLDNLVFKILERANGVWVELLVDDGAFVRGAPVEGFDHVEAPDGARIPWHTAAAEWLGRAKALVRRGHIALIDYGRPTTAELVGRDWLRTYQGHGRGFDPLDQPGSRDITTDIAFDQLSPDRLTRQADWLRSHGIDALVEQARATWTERAAIGDLVALKARSRVNEADALTDPTGLGAFLVAEWDLT